MSTLNRESSTKSDTKLEKKVSVGATEMIDTTAAAQKRNEGENSPQPEGGAGCADPQSDKDIEVACK